MALITNAAQVATVVGKIMPTHIFHLAGFSSVVKSFEHPDLCFNVNVEGTKNLLNTIMVCGIKPRILIVSSSEIYGKPEYIPIDESHPLKPVSPYGESRVAQEKVCKEYGEKGLNIIIARSFNHTGPNQSETFVIPSFRKQVQDAKDGDIIRVGNIDIIRDFSDVQDTVRAYRILLEKGTIGEIYNVGSGNGYRLRDILDSLIKESGKHLKVAIDQKKYRKADIEEQVCNPDKIRMLIGFRFRKIV